MPKELDDAGELKDASELPDGAELPDGRGPRPAQPPSMGRAALKTPTFMRVSLAQFEQLLREFKFSRQIDAVHMHHTWKPAHADFRGHETIVAMWRHHTQTNGWRDIAQHITIDPQGGIWLGRNWNHPPASAAGFNGNSAFGPFMFEMVGNFDHGFDRFEGEQRGTVLGVIAAVQERFGLPLESLRFHNMMSAKSCPGTAIDHGEVLQEVRQLREHARSRGVPGGGPRSPFPQEEAQALQRALQALQRLPAGGQEPGDAELTHREHAHWAPDGAAAPHEATSASRGPGLDAAALAALRPHLINLTLGRLSPQGEASSTAGDVDALFEQHLPRWLQENPAAAGRPRRIVFFAHGGLVSEGAGLDIAHKHVRWWLDNGIYPIYFIWETGFFETIGQLLQRARQRGARDLFDFTTDPLIELAARALQGPRIWGGMKASAEHAVDAPTDADPVGGGAHYAARRLKGFCDRHAAEVELHAVGHSAGAIFHAHFLPAAVGLGVPAFRSAQLLAPAIRVDTFKQLLLGGVEKGSFVQRLTVYTMNRDQERDDNCARIYRKSLLYLIHHALEDQPRTPILGLEESLRADAALKQLFRLGQAAPGPHEVIWSPSPGDSGRSASRSTTHGGFDDDPPTMNSVARRILDKADADPIVEYRVSRGIAREWVEEIDWPQELQSGLAPLPALPMPPAAPPPPPAPAALPGWLLSMPPAPPPPALPVPGGGRRRALCVGIDLYPHPEHRLAGCVNDARRWEQALRALGFETTLLVNAQATRAALEQHLAGLVDASRSGDVIVFQYAGHGTQVDDLNGDEQLDGRDEALCPVDFADGALFIDDDVAEVFGRVPPGVNLTCFMDCCHSGTNSRFAVGTSARAPQADAKARFITATAELQDAHRRFRALHRGARAATGTGGRERMRDVKFSACQDHEVAWESNGSGEFTLRAMRVLAAGVQGLSNGDFVSRVVADFGSGARQRPMLDCADDGVARQPLLQPLHAAQGAAADGGRGAGAEGAVQLLQALQALQTLQSLQSLQSLLQGGNR